MMKMVLACEAENIDQTGQCTSGEWVVLSSGIPPLSASEGAQIGLAIALSWAVAWGVRAISRLLR